MNTPPKAGREFCDLWATVLPSPASHRGGTLRVVAAPGLLSAGTSVDPAVFAGLSQWQLLSLTNDGLVTYRRVGGLAGATLVPDLATALPTPTNGGRTYTFQLRSGIHYSNGALVTPDDFRRAIERVFRVGDSYPESFYTGIVGAKRCAHIPRTCSLSRGIVTDDHANTVTFHLTAADPDFLYKLAYPMADATPKGTPNHDLQTTPLPATGPYMTQSVTPYSLTTPSGHRLAFHSWTLVRNPHFHQWSPAAQPAGYPDRIVLTQDTSPDQAVTRLEHGGTDVLLSPPSNRLHELATHHTNQLHSGPLAATLGFVMNTRVPPFDHPAVRRALNYSIDRNRILSFTGGPLTAHATCQILPPTLPGYQPYCPYTTDPNPSGSWTAPDLAKAEQLVRASGTRGTNITVSIIPADPTDPTDKIGPYIVSILDQLGYRASLHVLTNIYPSRIANSRTRTQIAWFTWYQDYPAPSDFINPLLTCRSFIPRNQHNLNMTEFCNPTIDTQIRRAQTLQAPDPGAASQIWTRIDHELADQAPWLPLYNPQVLIALSTRVGNYQYHPFWQLLLDQLWVR